MNRQHAKPMNRFVAGSAKLDEMTRLSLEDDLSDGLLNGMRDAERDIFHAESIRDFPCFAF